MVIKEAGIWWFRRSSGRGGSDLKALKQKCAGQRSEAKASPCCNLLATRLGTSMDKGKQRVIASKPPPNPSSHNWALPKCWYHKYTRENSSYLHNNNTVNNENYLLHWPHPTKQLFIMNILQIGAKKWIRINENFKNYCPIAWNHVGRLVWAIWSFAIYFYVYLIEDGSVTSTLVSFILISYSFFDDSFEML